MLPASAEFIAAADSPEQRPIARVWISWDGTGTYDGDYDQITGFASVDIDRGLVTSLPAAAMLITGASSAEAVIELAVGETLPELRDAAWQYSRLNTESPLHEYGRVGLPIKIEIGYRTAAGPQTLRRLTGRITKFDVKASQGRARVTAADFRIDFAGEIALPPVVADQGDGFRKPGLDSQWLIDYILRRSGRYVSPPPIGNAAVIATLHGSAQPEVGQLLEAWRSPDGTTRNMLTFLSSGHYAEALETEPGPRPTQDHGVSIWVAPDQDHPISTVVGAQFHAEISALVGADSNGTLTYCGHSTQTNYIHWIIEDGVISLYVKRRSDGGTYQLSIPALANTEPEWMRLGAELEWTTTGANARFRVGDTTYLGTFVIAFIDVMAPFDAIALLPDMPVEAWQVSNAATNVWTDGFIPQVDLDPSMNRLVAVVDTTAPDAWQVLKDLAEAEAATVHFDEAGMFHFWSRAHWVTEQAQTITKVVDAASQIRAVDYADGINQIANIVAAPVTAYTLGPGVDNLWVAPDSFVVVAAQTTTTFEVDLGKAATGIKTRFLPYYDPTRSWFEARVSPGGAIDYVDVRVTAEVLSAQKVRITVLNRATTPRYLLEAANKPSLHLWGRPIETVRTSDTSAVATDADSRAQFGDKKLTLSNNTWRQDHRSAMAIAQAVLSDTAYPLPTFVGVKTPGDPRLQLGDRHTLRVGNIGLDGPYRAVSAQESFSDAGYDVTADYVSSPPVLVWDEGNWNEAVWGA